MSGAISFGTRTSNEPLIKLLIGPHREEVYFLVDTGAEKSTIRKLPKGVKEGKRNTMVVGAKGEPFKVPILENIESEKKLCLNDLLLVAEAEHNLLGRDLIIRLGLEIKSRGEN